MVSELNRQRDFINQAKKEGGWGYKTTNATMVGLPDITMFISHLPVIVVEMKVVPHKRAKFKATRKQIQTAERIHKTRANCIHAWVAYVEDQKCWYIFNDIEDIKDPRIPDNAIRVARNEKFYDPFKRLMLRSSREKLRT